MHRKHYPRNAKALADFPFHPAITFTIGGVKFEATADGGMIREADDPARTVEALHLSAFLPPTGVQPRYAEPPKHHHGPTWAECLEHGKDLGRTLALYLQAHYREGAGPVTVDGQTLDPVETCNAAGLTFDPDNGKYGRWTFPEPVVELCAVGRALARLPLTLDEWRNVIRKGLTPDAAELRGDAIIRCRTKHIMVMPESLDSPTLWRYWDRAPEKYGPQPEEHKRWNLATPRELGETEESWPLLLKCGEVWRRWKPRPEPVAKPIKPEWYVGLPWCTIGTTMPGGLPPGVAFPDPMFVTTWPLDVRRPLAEADARRAEAERLARLAREERARRIKQLPLRPYPGNPLPPEQQLTATLHPFSL